MQLNQVGEFESSKSAMNTRAPEFSALITILRSTGPVISTRRSAISAGRGGDAPVAGANVRRLGQEVRQLAGVEALEALGPAGEQLDAPRAELALQVGQEGLCLVGEDVRGVDHRVIIPFRLERVASSAAATRSACASEKTSGGRILITLSRGPVAPTRTPRRRRPFATALPMPACPGASQSSSTPTKRPGPAHLPDHRVRRRHLGEARAEVGADALGLLGEPLALDHVEHGRADGGGDRGAGEGREEVPALGELRGDRRGRDHGAHRVAVAHRLAERDDVGHDAVLGKAPERLADAAEPRLHLVGDAERARRAGAGVRGAEVAGRHGEDAVAREDVVADQERRPVTCLAQPGEGAVDLARDPLRGVAGAERGGAADPRHPRLERGRAELLGRQRRRRRRRAVVGVLRDHGAAVAGDGARDLDRDVVRLAARVDEHDDRELAGQQRREPVGVRGHLVDEVAGVRGQPARLRGERRRHAGVGVPDLRHVVVGVEQPVAVDVGEPDAVARLEAHGSS